MVRTLHIVQYPRAFDSFSQIFRNEKIVNPPPSVALAGAPKIAPPSVAYFAGVLLPPYVAQGALRQKRLNSGPLFVRKPRAAARPLDVKYIKRRARNI